jgi:hypothetical protein
VPHRHIKIRHLAAVGPLYAPGPLRASLGVGRHQLDHRLQFG